MAPDTKASCGIAGFDPDPDSDFDSDEGAGHSVIRHSWVVLSRNSPTGIYEASARAAM
jgi:hypothetical protein